MADEFKILETWHFSLSFNIIKHVLAKNFFSNFWNNFGFEQKKSLKHYNSALITRQNPISFSSS
jgi:hypothetical protein